MSIPPSSALCLHNTIYWVFRDSSSGLKLEPRFWAFIQEFQCALSPEATSPMRGRTVYGSEDRHKPEKAQTSSTD